MLDSLRPKPNHNEVEVLKFALNLEYLESEFYTYALYGEALKPLASE